MAEIFVRVHSPLFFCHFSSTFLQVRLPIQFTTFKSLFTPNVQIQVTLSLLNCSLFPLSVQFLFTLSLSNCVLDTLGVWILVILSLFNCDLVTLSVQILVTAPKIYVSRVVTAFVTIMFNVLASDFNGSTSRLTRGLCGRARIFIRQCF